MSRIDELDGFLLVDKPAGLTSFSVVARVRKLSGARKVGHAGTLDPIATGLLVLALGKATKRIGPIADLSKEYLFSLQFGTRTDTDDMEGKILSTCDASSVSLEAIEGILPEFRGRIMQVPPRYSAIKISGRRAYALARSGIEPELKPRQVTVHRLDLLDVKPPAASFLLQCSKGTYVRSLARDMGERLGCGACVSRIRRTQIGSFRVDNALALDSLTPGNIAASLQYGNPVLGGLRK